MAGEAAVAEVLARIERSVLALESRVQEGAIGGLGQPAGQPGSWRRIEGGLRYLRRPPVLTEVAPMAKYVIENEDELYGESGLPLEIALMGLRDVLDRFGWPDEITAPTGSGESFHLSYRTGEPAEEGRPEPTLVIDCTQSQTLYIDVER